jgi:hypothetical protein
MSGSFEIISAPMRADSAIVPPWTRTWGKTGAAIALCWEAEKQHPDVVKITRKWGRWQHHVDYRPFKKNKLIKKPGLIIPDGPNEYGMVLKDNRNQAK